MKKTINAQHNTSHIGDGEPLKAPVHTKTRGKCVKWYSFGSHVHWRLEKPKTLTLLCNRPGIE